MNADGTGVDASSPSGPASRTLLPRCRPTARGSPSRARAVTRMHLPSELAPGHLRDGHRRLRRHACADQPMRLVCWRGPNQLDPDWSPDGDRLVFIWWAADADCEQELDYVPERIETIRPDGTRRDPAEGRRRRRAALKPAPGHRTARGIVYSAYCCERRSDGDRRGRRRQPRQSSPEAEEPDWQPLPVNTPSTHVRPAGASPLPRLAGAGRPSRARRPTAPTARRSHSPPAPARSRARRNLTVGVGDGSLAFARSIGYVRMDVQLGAPGGVGRHRRGDALQPLERDERLRPVRVHGRAARERPGCASPTASPPGFARTDPGLPARVRRALRRAPSPPLDKSQLRARPPPSTR